MEVAKDQQKSDIPAQDYEIEVWQFKYLLVLV